MSEYQYFEFKAIDRLLAARELTELRKYSTRATITSSQFVNEYHFGDFKGDSTRWMERYFDGFLYFANWGSRELILRFPTSTLNTALIDQYCIGEYAKCWKTKTHTLVRYSVEDFEGDQWCKDDNGSLSNFLKLRSNVLEDEDYRLFYLGWLLAVQYGNVDDKELEPPVPQGLQALSKPLRLFVEFFGIDDQLIKVAAQNSTKEIRPICDDDIEPCIAGLGSGEKFNWLCRLALESNKNLGAEFRRYILPDSGVEIFCDGARRSVGELRSR